MNVWKYGGWESERFLQSVFPLGCWHGRNTTPWLLGFNNLSLRESISQLTHLAFDSSFPPVLKYLHCKYVSSLSPSFEFGHKCSILRGYRKLLLPRFPFVSDLVWFSPWQSNFELLVILLQKTIVCVFGQWTCRHRGLAIGRANGWNLLHTESEHFRS